MTDVRGKISIQRRGNILNIKNSLLQVAYDLANGTWGYQDKSGYHVIRNAYCRVELEGGTFLTTLDAEERRFSTQMMEDELTGPYIQVRFSHKCKSGPISVTLNIYLNLYESQNYLVIGASVEPEEGDEVKVHRIDVITVSPWMGSPVGGIFLGSQPTNYHVYLNTYSDHPSSVREVLDKVDLTGSGEICHNGLIYDTESKRSISFGFLGFFKWWGSIEMGYDSDLQPLKNYKGINRWSMYQIWNRSISEETFSEPVYINYTDFYRSAQETYVKLVSDISDAPRPPKPALRWNSKPKTGSVSEKWISDNIDWIDKNPGSLGLGEGMIEYIEVPWGWQRWNGVAEPAPDGFPNGLEPIVEKIHRFNMKAAIYFSPFETDEEWPGLNDLFDCILRDRSGSPTHRVYEGERRSVLLDPTDPKAILFVTEQIERIKKWGFDALLLDMAGYINHLDPSFSPIYRDKEITRIEAYRRGLSSVVEAARPMLVIPKYGCTSYNVGITSINSISIDAWRNPFDVRWEDKYGIPEMAKLWASKFYGQGVLWTNSIDAISISEPRPLNEVLILLTACALSGGMVSLVGSLIDLAKDRVELLGKILPLYGVPAIPVDLMESERPRIWSLDVKSNFDSWKVVGLFNWEDLPGDISIKMSDIGLSSSRSYIAHEFWTNEFLGEFQKSIDIYDIPPRSVLLLCLREQKNHPQIISTDIHFSQGGVEILSAGWDRRSSTLLASTRGYREVEGNIFIYVPPDFVPSSVSCFGSDYSYAWSPPILTITLSSLKDPVTLAVGFSRTRG